MKVFVTFLFLVSMALGNPALPERIAISEIKADSYYRSFGQYLHLENGEFTPEFGRVLVVKDGNDFELAFYRKDADVLVRVGGVVRFRGTNAPFASAMTEPAVPCISARKKDGTGRLNAFVSRGKPLVSESKE